MQVKYKEGIEVLVPARIVLVDMDEDGIYYGVESPFWTGITYGRESNIVKINEQHVNGIVSEDMLEEAARKARIEKRAAGKNCAGAKVEKQETTKSEPVTKSGKPRKKPGPKPKNREEARKTETPQPTTSSKGTNLAKPSSTSGTPELKKDGTPKKKPGPKRRRRLKEAAPAGQQEKAAPRQQEKKEDSEMVKLAKELAESVED